MGKERRRQWREAMESYRDQKEASALDWPAVSQSPRIDVSTEELADREREEAHAQDRDRGSASKHDRFEAGRFHSRSEGDRGTGSY